MAKKKTSKPQLPKKRTPQQAANKEAKEHRKQRARTRRDFDGTGQLIESIDTRNEGEDFSQAAARIVREATEKD